jgi:hypothetical protein
LEAGKFAESGKFLISLEGSRTIVIK